METKKFQSLIVALLVCLFACTHQVRAQVTITPVTNGTCLNVSPAAYTVMTNIVIKETAVNDISVQSGATFILTAPAGFEFNAGIGFVSFQSGRDITSASIVVTTSTITVTFDAPTDTQLDIIRIRNVRVRALSSNLIGDIYRPIAGGTAVINGDAAGSGISHGALTATGTGATISTIADGNWSNPLIWLGGLIPSCTDNVVINNRVTVDSPVGADDITINNTGNLIADNAITISGNFNIPGTGVYTHNNKTDAPSTVFLGTENFSVNSKIIINQWSSFTVPLASGFSGNFGEIEINTIGTWNQSGMFAPDKIKNTLTINSGYIIMDNGTGMTTALTTADVVVTGTGRIMFQTGTPRDFNLTTGNFTDNSTAGGLSSIVYRSIGNTVWTVNGDINIAHRFSIAEGQYSTDIGSLVVNVTGDLNISAGTSFDGARKITGPATFNITGNTTITGTPGNVMMKDYFTGDLVYNSGSMTVNSGTNVYFLGTHSSIGAVDVTITGDLTLTGNTTYLYGATFSGNSNTVSINVTNDAFITGSKLYTALTTGDVSVNIGRNYTQTGATSEFYGQRYSSGTSDCDVVISGSANISDGTYIQSQSKGSISIDVVEVLSVQNATFYGMNNASSGNNGDASLTCVDLSISGSSFLLHKGFITDGRTIPVNVTNDINIEFTSTSQEVVLVGRNSTNNAVLDMNVGGNVIVYGSADGLFCTSVSQGNETIDIGGDLLVQAGRVRFNSYESFSGARGHDVTGNIGGSFVMTGGSIGLSNQRGDNTWTIGGDYDQTGGYAIYKWNNRGTTSIDITGDFTLSNSLAVFHSVASLATSDPVTVVVNGNATLDNSTVMFDSSATSTATHKLVFKGSSVTYGDNTLFDHGAHLSTSLNFANIIYDRPGTITLRRTSALFDIRQTKQIITSNTVVDFSTSPFDLMISSHVSNIQADHTTLTIDGTLDMGTNMIAARDEASYFASLDLNNGARLITGHVNGLYSGTSTPSCIYPMIAGSTSMNFYLDANSIVEYDGVDTQILTGTGVGLATTPDHRYGILDINFNGTADVEYVHLINDSAQVRTALVLTKGELNLDEDHITNSSGHTLQVLNNAIVLRLSGYLRSETDDGTASISWNISSTGSYVVPFGYNSTNYIPYTFQVTAGNPGRTVFATNRVAPDNTPYPPTVNHVNDLSGANNSANTVDRFWGVTVPGNTTANMVFSFTASEAAGITSPRAQLWEPVSNGWFPPAPIQSNPTASTTQIDGVTMFNNWWTLSSSGSPLPIQLLSFDAAPQGSVVKLSWSTASELNNDFFTVEKSNDGENYTELTRIDGAGTSNSIHNYSAYDYDPSNGVNYYRLRQTDFDGTESLSDVKTVQFNSTSPVHVFPNPIIGHAMNISTANSRISAVGIYDLAGKLVMYQDVTSGSPDAVNASIDLGNKLSEGIYMVEITTDSGVHREKIMKY